MNLNLTSEQRVAAVTLATLAGADDGRMAPEDLDQVVDWADDWLILQTILSGDVAVSVHNGVLVFRTVDTLPQTAQQWLQRNRQHYMAAG